MQPILMQKILLDVSGSFTFFLCNKHTHTHVVPRLACTIATSALHLRTSEFNIWVMETVHPPPVPVAVYKQQPAGYLPSCHTVACPLLNLVHGLHMHSFHPLFTIHPFSFHTPSCSLYCSRHYIHFIVLLSHASIHPIYSGI